MVSLQYVGSGITVVLWLTPYVIGPSHLLRTRALPFPIECLVGWYQGHPRQARSPSKWVRIFTA